MVNSRLTTAVLTGTESSVEFAVPYNYYWVRNDGTDNLYVSLSSGVEPGADGVLKVPVGAVCCTMHDYPATKLYLLGTGSVQLCGTSSAFCPFKAAPKGGDDAKGLYLMRHGYFPYDLVQNYGSAHNTTNIVTYNGYWMHKPDCDITGGANDNSCFFSQAIDLGQYTAVHLIWQRAVINSWGWVGIYFAADTVGTNAQFLRRDCENGAYAWDWTSGKEVPVTTETQDYDIYQWDIDITAATGTYYLGLMESLGASNILAFWLD